MSYDFDSFWEQEGQERQIANTGAEKREAAAKAARFVGYEGGFPQAADGVKKDAAAMSEGVVSAERIPVAKSKVAAGQAAVLLLLNGEPVKSLQRHGFDYVPVQLIDEKEEDSFQVVMEAPTLLYRTNIKAKARRQQQIGEAKKPIADATDTLAELREALGRSKAAFKQAVETAADPDGDAELSDIGAMAVEQHRIKAEIKRQQEVLKAAQQQLAQLQSLTDAELELTEHRITPRFKLRAGNNILPSTHTSIPLPSGVQPQAERVVHVVRLPKKSTVAEEVQFEYGVKD